MSEEYTETEAYKQLLEVTENILASLNTEPEILQKYKTLKKSVLSKVIDTHCFAYEKDEETRLLHQLLKLYKGTVKELLTGISQFEKEIQGDMNKHNFLRKSEAIGKEMTDKVHKFESQTQIYKKKYSKSNISKDKSIALSLLLKQEISALNYTIEQFHSKFENMSLMVQVHQKMHEIILQASQRQTARSQQQHDYTQRMQEMEQVIDKIGDVRKFVDDFAITKDKYRKFELARKNLGKVLFDI